MTLPGGIGALQLGNNPDTTVLLLRFCHPPYGYRRIAALLRDAGWQVNDKRIERLWRREGLGDQERFCVATAGIRLFLGHDVCGKPGDLSPYARPFAGEDRDFSFSDILLRVLFARRAETFYAANFKCKVRHSLMRNH